METIGLCGGILGGSFSRVKISKLEPITSQTSVAWAIWWGPGVVRHSEIGRYSVKMNDANQAKAPSILTGEHCAQDLHMYVA